MSYPLFPLHQIIDKLIQPVQLTTAGQAPCDGLSIIQQAIAEAQAFPLTFMQQAAGAKNSKALQILVHTTQAGCTSLLNRLSIYISTPGNATPGNSTTQLADCKTLQESLLSGLLYLQQHFPAYFDKEQQLPVVYRLQEQKKLEEHYQSIIVQWQNSSLNPELQAIALAPLQ